MADGRINNGGARKGAGRPSKTDEHKLIEKLSPLEDIAHEALSNSVREGESWAIKLYFEYMYGKPKQILETKDITTPRRLSASELRQIGKELDEQY